MLLSTLKPVVGCLPSSSGAHGHRVNVPPATMLRVNPKMSSSSSSSNALQAQETQAAVTRRDVMCIAAAGVAISLAKPAEAVEVANAGNPISQFLELLKGLVGTPPKPKSEGDEKKPPVDNKAELSKPEGDQQQPTANGEAELSEPNAQGDDDAGKAKAETEAVGKN